MRDQWEISAVGGLVSGRGHPGHQDRVNENEPLETVGFVPKGYGNNRQRNNIKHETMGAL